MKVLVTGASGFIGQAVLLRLHNTVGMTAVGSVRDNSTLLGDGSGPKIVSMGELSEQANWVPVLDGFHAVVHTAARVHVMSDSAPEPLLEYRRVNVGGTLTLARQAADAGVKRFIFLSSIKVNGESTCAGVPFTADDEPRPVDAYGISKMEAEKGLLDVAANTGMEVVIIRPPLVYGPGVKANFALMMRCLWREFPLPLGAIDNRRSLVALDNLVDLVLTCLNHPRAANQIFLVSDDEDVSSTQLLYRLGEAMNKSARLIPVPMAWLRFVASVLGKSDVIQRVCDTLQVDIEKTRRLLEWKPVITLDEGLRKAASILKT